MGCALFGRPRSLGLGNDVVASIQLIAVFRALEQSLAFAIGINRYRYTIVNGAVDVRWQRGRLPHAESSDAADVLRRQDRNRQSPSAP